MSKNLRPLAQWWSGLFNSDRWEAPERGFIGHRDILVQSRARYEFVAPYTGGRLLDVGCGRGYGFEALASRAEKQVGIDVSMIFLTEAQRVSPQSFFICGVGDSLPFASDSFDSVLAFEVIEHSRNDQLFLSELKRVARNGAMIAVSTPNRMVSSGSSAKPLNRFHFREYAADEFCDLLKQKFSSVDVYGQHERLSSENPRNKMVDQIPIRWKYLVPHLLQTLLSVALRPPLRIEECQFRKSRLDQAATLLAICRR